jgi:trk system potassium uptake protein TrkH
VTDVEEGSRPGPRGRAVAALKQLIPSGGHPARAVFAGFAAFILLGTGLLMLPVAAENGQATDFITALFTATSAVCVTGLALVDTPEHWSTFGEVVILGLFQVGGIGILTLASLLGLLVARRFGLRMQMTMQAEMRGLGFQNLGTIVRRIVLISLAVEAVLAVVLTVRFAAGYDMPFGSALYSGVFHAVSAYTGAGFSIYSDSLVQFASDAWIGVPVCLVAIIGSIGFPVIFEVARRTHRPHQWSLHTKITLLTTAALLVIGFLFVLIAEWANPATLGPLGVGGKLVAGFFAAVTPRSVGLNTIDVGSMRSETLLLNDVLMFIGGGSASTAGGIKVTTFALLAFVIIAEVRGEPTVHVMGRRLPAVVQRQALTVALIGVGLVMTSTMVLLALTDHSLDRVLFEVISAFSTCGLSTGITAELPAAAEAILIGLMFVGRLGPITAATALALRERIRRYELPEERPIVG